MHVFNVFVDSSYMIQGMVAMPPPPPPQFGDIVFILISKISLTYTRKTQSSKKFPIFLTKIFTIC
jgi:hypothetical protein